MTIAILGWGSLVWDMRALATVADWQPGGPVLPIEFSRKSRDGRLTLVIDPANGEQVATRYIRSRFENLNDAIGNLREREGNPHRDHIGYVNLVAHTERAWARQNQPAACDTITAWAQANDWQTVIWTALLSNFEEEQREPFTVPAAIRYLNGLNGETETRALEYIRRAPPETLTPLRRAFQPQAPREPAAPNNAA
jgi:hypothetical protein